MRSLRLYILNDIERYTLLYIYYASVTVNVILISVAIDHRQCKNLSVCFQCKIFL
jgi:hypothetical protein